MIQLDPEAARQTWHQEGQNDVERAGPDQSDILLPYRNAAARYADFHALWTPHRNGVHRVVRSVRLRGWPDRTRGLTRRQL